MTCNKCYSIWLIENRYYKISNISVRLRVWAHLSKKLTPESATLNEESLNYDKIFLCSVTGCLFAKIKQSQMNTQLEENAKSFLTVLSRPCRVEKWQMMAWPHMLDWIKEHISRFFWKMDSNLWEVNHYGRRLVAP